MSRRACVIGAGPNGLSAAIVLAQAGMRVDVFEAEPQPGGGARTLELTLPGYHHDFGSAVHPLAIGSPFFSSLSLEKRGLKWIHSPAALAHPLDDGTAVVLEQDLARAESLGEDAGAWRRLMRPFSEHWSDLASAALRPLTVLPQHPLLMAKLGLKSFPSARTMSRRFRNERTRALLAGMAAHSFLSLEQPIELGCRSPARSRTACGRLADPGGWRAIDHQRTLPLSYGTGSQREHLCSNREPLGGSEL